MCVWPQERLHTSQGDTNDSNMILYNFLFHDFIHVHSSGTPGYKPQSVKILFIVEGMCYFWSNVISFFH